MKTFLEVLQPSVFEAQFKALDAEIADLDHHIGRVQGLRMPEPQIIPDPPGRPDMADVLMLGNEGIEEVNDSVLDAEFDGVLRRLDYPLPLEPR